MSIWKDQDRGHWRYQFQHRGQTYTGRGYSTRREASAAREKRREQVLAQERIPQTAITFSDFAGQYLDFASKKFAPKVYRYKAYIYSHFIQFSGDPPIDQITSSDIFAYLSTRPTNNDYNNHRKDLSVLWNWGRKVLKIPYPNPVLDLDKLPHSPAPKTIPTEEEIVKIILAAAPGDEQDLVLVCLHTLGRIDEVLRMTWQDVNLEKRMVTLWTRKRRNGSYEPDALPMGDDLYEVLLARWKSRSQDRWVFINPDTGTRYMQRPKLMASLCKRAGIAPLGQSKRLIGRGKKRGQYRDHDLYYGFHAFRHFMASYMFDTEKVGLAATSKLLRHKQLRTTEIYLHSIDENVRSAVGQITGKFTKPHPASAPKNKEEVTNIS